MRTLQTAIALAVPRRSLLGCSKHRTNDPDDESGESDEGSKSDDNSYSSGSAGKCTSSGKTSTGEAPTGSKNHCKAVAWANPGKLAIPEVESVVANAGTTGHMFDRYVKKYIQAADEARSNGYLVIEDHDVGVKEAKNAPIPH